MEPARYEAFSHEDKDDGWYINRYQADEQGTMRRDTVYDLMPQYKAEVLAKLLTQFSRWEIDVSAQHAPPMRMRIV